MSIDKPEEFDLIILGRGAAAFSAAIKASELTPEDLRPSDTVLTQSSHVIPNIFYN